MKYQYRSLLLLMVMGYLASCTPKYIPRSKKDLKDNLSRSMVKFDYHKETFEGTSKPLQLLAFNDTTQLVAHDITNELEKLIDYGPEQKYTFYRKQKFSGYRIQIYRGRSRSEAYRVRRRSYQLFPHLKPYMEYKEPSYRIKVGDFVHAPEYTEVLDELKKEFPLATIVPAIVRVTIEYNVKYRSSPIRWD
ncbi:SPOR domain-containing protein [uncultured Microscilla sp.]|uniref:SPOR domain-containing protein n=1 Tax=uncultured Microscilla sp. TaxID=432653 RepID=UPI0026017C14|nr:SPOR domain-containing protein [uncultured Microscilla sp.]